MRDDDQASSAWKRDIWQEGATDIYKMKLSYQENDCSLSITL